MNKRILLVSSLFIAISLSAQEKGPKMSFDKKIVDFGTIDERLGKVTTSFKFKNTGNGPLLIKETYASCGCTTSEYPAYPIAPGDSGKIRVTYDAKGRPGSFEKNIQIFTNASTGKEILFIKGYVIDKPKTKLDDYRRRVGALAVDKTRISFNQLELKEEKNDTLRVYNPGDKKIFIRITGLPSSFKISSIPSFILPKQEGLVIINIQGASTLPNDIVRESFTLYSREENQKEFSQKISLVTSYKKM